MSEANNILACACVRPIEGKKIKCTNTVNAPEKEMEEEQEKKPT